MKLSKLETRMLSILQKHKISHTKGKYAHALGCLTDKGIAIQNNKGWKLSIRGKVCH